MSKSRKMKIGAVTASLLVTVVIIATVNSKGAGGIDKPAIVPIAVEVTPATTSTITDLISATGTIAAINDVIVSSETSGRVTRVYVKVGDFVRTGQTLVQVDDELKGIAVEQARAQLLAAQTSHAKARSDLDRANSLFESGDMARAELDSYRIAYRAGEAGEKSAEVALRQAQRQYNDTRIKAPISGFVAATSIDLGEMVTPGTHIANLVDLRKVKVKLSIPEDDVVKLSLGQEALLHVDSYPDLKIHGVVYTIGKKTEDPMGHSYPVEVVVEKNTDLLKVGMFSRVEIQIASVPGALTASREALVNEDTEPALFVVENNVARLRPVTLGIHSGELVQILSGVKEGDQVISFGQKKVKDGSPVQIRR